VGSFIFFVNIYNDKRFCFDYPYNFAHVDNAEIKKRLIEGGLIERFRGSEKLWQLAFKEYNFANGTNLKPNCGRCFQKVKEFILKF